MAFPDTYYPADIFKREFAGDFNLILFETDEPERFGVVADDAIWDKSDLYTGHQHAYGAVVWSMEVVEFWKDHLDVIIDHTHAFNLAMTEFGFETYHMDYYHDMATFEDYVEFLRMREAVHV
jgi:hypothetical protein